jgi:drug/metabolite transporter (DMT)-like permease
MVARVEPSGRAVGPVRLGTYLGLAAVVLFWASSWVFMRPALHDIGPLQFTALRVVIATLPIAVLLPVRRIAFLPVRGERWPIAFIGFWQVAAILILGSTGVQWVPSGRASLLVYTMQIWAMPLGWLLSGDRLSTRHLWGGVLALAGIAVLFDPAAVDWHDPNALLGNGLLIAAAISWAVGACLYRRRRWHTPFWTQTFWQLFTSSLVLIPLALVVERDHAVRWTPAMITIVTYCGTIATGLSYWLYARGLAVMPASQVGQILSLVPFVALLMSATLFGETVNLAVGLGIALIGGGIYLTMLAQASLRR